VVLIYASMAILRCLILRHPWGINYEFEPVDLEQRIPMHERSRFLDLWSPVLSFVWFCILHVCLVTWSHPCKLAAPHIWWLTFAALCPNYLILGIWLLGLVLWGCGCIDPFKNRSIVPDDENEKDGYMG